MAKLELPAVLYVIGTDGEIITRGSLPPAFTQYWRIRMKAKVVAAVESGLVTREEVCVRYRMSDEEYFEWRRKVEEAGLRGWVTKHRNPDKPADSR